MGRLIRFSLLYYGKPDSFFVLCLTFFCLSRCLGEANWSLLVFASDELLNPPAGLVIGLLLLFRGSDTSRSWARGCLLAALAGAVVITVLLLLRGVIHS